MRPRPEILLKLTLTFLLLSVFNTACRRSQNISRRTSASAVVAPAPSPGPDVTPPAVPSVESQYDLANADALILVEYTPGVSSLVGEETLLALLAGSIEPQVVLAKADFFGRLVYAGHPAFPGPKATDLVYIPPNGHLVTFGSPKGSSTLTVIGNSWIETALKEETATAEAPFVAKSFEYSERLVLRVVGENGHLLVISPTDSATSLINDPAILKRNISVATAISTSDGDIFAESTDGKVFHLRTDSQVTGFVEEIPIPSLDGGFAVGVRLFVGNRTYRTNAGETFYSYLPEPVVPSSGLNHSPALLAGAWGLAGAKGSYAVNMLSGRIVANPFSETAIMTASRLDSGTGATFDGFSIIGIAATATRIAITLTGKIAIPVASNLKVRRLFGPDHGFTASFFAFAESAGVLYWAPVDKTTGVLNTGAAVPWTLDPSAGTLDEFMANTTPYKVGDKIMLLRRAAGSALAEAQFPVAGGALTLRVIDVALGSVLRHDLGALDASGNLLFTTGENDIIHAYDPVGDLVTIRAQPNLALLAGETACTRRFLGLVPKAPAHLPSAIVRFCPGNDILALVPFTDETFATAAVPLNLTYPKAGANEPAESVIVIRDQTGQILLNDAGTSEVIIVSADELTVTARLTSEAVITEGFLALSAGFDTEQTRGLKVFPWTGTKIIINGQSGGKYISQLVDLATRTRSPLPDLDNYAIDRAGQGRSKRLIMDAVDDSGAHVIIRLETNNSVLGIDRNYSVTVLDIEPF